MGKIVHEELIKFGILLGYVRTGDKGELKGICTGFTYAWLDAALIGDTKVFESRISRILEEKDLPEKINAVREKVKQHEVLTDNDLDLLEVLGFYEKIALYHYARDFSRESPSIFNRPLEQYDIEPLSQFASSKKLEELGGIVQVYSDLGIYTEEEVAAYLDNIAQSINSLTYETKTAIGVFLSSRQHGIGLTYDVTLKHWTFMDINQWPPKAYVMQDTKHLAKALFYGFRAPKDYLVLSTTTITTGNDKKCSLLADNLKILAESRPITKKSYEQQANTNLLTLAVVRGNLRVIAELGKAGVDFNTLDSDGLIPLHSAIRHNNVLMVAELAKYGADFNQPDKFGDTAIHLAAQRGDIQTINIAAEHHGNFNKSNNIGDTAIHLALERGNIQMIAELVKHGADLNKPDKFGKNALHLAIERWDLQMIMELVKHNIDLDALDSYGNAPAHIAAENGNIDIMAELAKHHVDLNQLNESGKAPIHLAAERGDVKMIEFLAKHDADLQKTTSDGRTAALLAGSWGWPRDEVIATLEKYSIDHKSSVDTTTSPSMETKKKLQKIKKDDSDKDPGFNP